MAKGERKFLGVVYYVSTEAEATSNGPASRRSSPLPAWFVVLSWLASLGLVGAGLFSTPYMRKVVAGQASESLLECAVAFLIAGVLCGWPWLLAYIKAHDQRRRGQAIAFASVAMVVAAYVYVSILNAPMEGVGYSIAIGVLLTWLAYPITRALGTR